MPKRRKRGGPKDTDWPGPHIMAWAAELFVGKKKKKRKAAKRTKRRKKKK
jgi:hypothetical protein